MSMWLLLLLLPAGFAIGWPFGYGKGRETYAKEVGEQAQQIKGLWQQCEALENEIARMGGVIPSRDDSVRVLDMVSNGADRD